MGVFEFSSGNPHLLPAFFFGSFIIFMRGLKEKRGTRSFPPYTVLVPVPGTHVQAGDRIFQWSMPLFDQREGGRFRGCII